MSVEAGIPMATKDLKHIKSVVTQIAEHLFFLDKKRLPVGPLEREEWLRERGYLQRHETRYSDALQLVAPQNEGRQRFLEQFFVGRRPTAFHEAVARFVSRGYFRSTFTTNFDPLLERAMLFSGLDVAVVADSDVVSKLAIGSGPVVYKVHGDYLLTNHKHTVEETNALEEAMRQRLVSAMARRPLLVIGYSGSDPSIMNALAEGLAVSSEGSEVLWLLYKNEEPGPLLLNLEQQFGNLVHIASVPGYREFWSIASRRILDRSPVIRYDPRIVASYFVGRTEVTVLRGDITEVGVEAIVSSDDCSMTHAGGVSWAIAQAAGEALESDLAQFAPLLPLSPGNVVVTGAGRLADRGVRYIIHAAITSDWRVPARAEDARNCTSRVMMEAEVREIRTLAIPALGGGQGGLDADEVASAMVGSVIEYLQGHSHLKQLVLVLNSEKAVEAERQMDAIKQRQEERLRETLGSLDSDLAALGHAMLDQENWGIIHGDLLSTWLREMAARGGDPAGQAVRYCHARWHTQLCRMLARLEDEPGLTEQVDQQRRQVQALEIAYATAFQ